MGPRLAQGSVLGRESWGSFSGDAGAPSPLSQHLPRQGAGDGTQAAPVWEEFSVIQSKQRDPSAVPRQDSLLRKVTGKGKLRQGADCWGGKEERSPPSLSAHPHLPSEDKQDDGSGLPGSEFFWLCKVHSSLASAPTTRNPRPRAKPNTHLIKLQEKAEAQPSPAPLPGGIAHARDDRKRL